MSKFILREEYFGGTIYDRENLIFYFLDKNEISSLKNGESVDKGFLIDSDDVEYRSGSEKNFLTGILYSPVRVYFEITRKCNLKCKNCFMSRDLSSCEMSFDDILKTLDGLRDDNVIEVRITGGEPTQRDDWHNILMKAKKRGFVVSLNTNGVYESTDVIDDLIKLAPEQIIISLDGLKKAHEKMRGEGTFNAVLETIKHLNEAGMKLRVNTMLNKYTLNDLKPMVELASNYSAELCFILFRPTGHAFRLRGIIPPIEKLNNCIREIEDLRGRNRDVKIMTSYDIISQNAIKPSYDLDLTSCAAGLRGLNINSDGGIYACGFLAGLGEQFKLGNIIEERYSISKIWRYSQQLKGFRKRSLEKTNECKICPDYRKNCFGSCIVMENYVQNQALKNDPYCYHDCMNNSK